jgi:separase
MLEAIQHKYPPRLTDDLSWPILNSEGISAPRSQPKISHLSYDDALDEEDGSSLGESPLTAYWNDIQTRYQSQVLDPASLSVSQMTGLPSNWTVVHISVTEDKSTLFITRQEGGETCRSPLIFCVPLKGRRDNGSGEEEEEHLTFENALNELKDIVRLSDEGTKSAIHIKADDREARSAWWKTRMELDTRMRELLENIEFCWLGAFKVRFICSSFRLSSTTTDDFKPSSKPYARHDT